MILLIWLIKSYLISYKLFFYNKPTLITLLLCVDILNLFHISKLFLYQLKGHSEFYCTFKIYENEIQSLLDKLNDDWEGEMEDCICYGFNTKMFHELVYCLEFTLFD